jgi:hypothetical protein
MQKTFTSTIFSYQFTEMQLDVVVAGASFISPAGVLISYIRMRIANYLTACFR